MSGPKQRVVHSSVGDDLIRNLHYWDPALIDDLAAGRRVVPFDNRGVGGTTGMTPDTIEAMAHDAIGFVEAMGLKRVVDLLGFSIGSFIAQEIALIRPMCFVAAEDLPGLGARFPFPAPQPVRRRRRRLPRGSRLIPTWAGRPTEPR